MPGSVLGAGDTPLGRETIARKINSIRYIEKQD